jgi:hypothetical protein
VIVHLPKTSFRTLISTAILVCFWTPKSQAGHEEITIEHLKSMNVEELDRLFACGSVNEMPVGHFRGRVLIFCDAKHPKLRAKLSNTFWKGKEFDCDGDFINQFPGFKALRSHAEIQASWFDGKPCIAMEYKRSTPIFGNTHDEIREICPGFYLGRFYDRCPCPKFRGYFVLQADCRK